MELPLWLLIGLIASVFLHALNKDFKNLDEITVGEISFVLALGAFGPITFILSVVLMIIVGVMFLGEWFEKTKFFERRIKLWNRK